MRDRGDGGTGGQALFKVYALESHGSYMVAFCQRLKSAVIFTSIPLKCDGAVQTLQCVCGVVVVTVCRHAVAKEKLDFHVSIFTCLIW